MRVTLPALLLLAATPAFAATSASWNSLDKAARGTCDRPGFCGALFSGGSLRCPVARSDVNIHRVAGLQR